MDSLAADRLLHTLNAPEDVGALRRLVRRIAVGMRASDAECGRAELVVTELGTNTLHHALPPGYILLQRVAQPRGVGLEIIAVDRGPGIANLAAVLGGMSASAHEGGGEKNQPVGKPLGLGCGLASIRRLASEFDIHTVPGRGTVVLARVLFEPPARDLSLRWGQVTLPVLGEIENGDAWALALQPTGCALLVADGLGHGPAAARASQQAVALFQGEPEIALEQYFEEANGALRTTRGAAISACRIFIEQNKLQFVGVGNVEGRVQSAAGSFGLTPRPGTIGMNLFAPKVQVRELAWDPGSILVLHSDGLRHPFDLDELGGELSKRDPTLIAAALHRDFGRARDDATVVVLRDTRGASP
jgi:anti-sigma regulatory factor (Ser/Thr protein kinase)